MLKHALTLKESVLYKDFSAIGALRPYIKKSLGINYEVPEMIYRDGEMWWNYDSDQDFNRAFLKGRSLNQAIAHLNKSMARATKKLATKAEAIINLNDWPPRDRQTAQNLFNRYTEAYLLNTSFLFTFWNAENLIIKQLKVDLESIYGFDQAEQKLQTVLVPSQDSYFSKEQKSFAKIALKISKNRFLNSVFRKHNLVDITKEVNKRSDLVQAIEKNIQNYGFTTTYVLLGRGLSFADIIKRLKVALSADILTKIKDKNRAARREKRECEKITKQLRAYPDIYKRVGLAQELMYWKNQRLDVAFRTDFLLRPLYRYLAKLMGLSYLDLVHLRLDEIRNWFAGHKVPGKYEIARRQKAYTLHLKNGQIELISDPKLFPTIEFKEDRDQLGRDKDTILGTTAYLGKATGTVRLVLSNKDVKKVKSGDILVTNMTRPEMMFGLEKAAAFVTDEGGMLSHAAIVAREMKKPCVIGTKIATSVLKHGDMVEVDANKGIVKKINGK